MKIDKIKLDEIIPSEYNPRVMSPSEQKKLTQNLEEFGLVDPIIINLKNNHIIGGHQRYNVLREKMGTDVDYEDGELKLIRLGDIGWVFEDDKLTIKDENHEKALNIALNKISGEWDFGKLDELFDELNVNNFNLELTGFDKDYFGFDIDFSEQPLDTLPQLSQFENTDETITEQTSQNEATDRQELQNEEPEETNDSEEEYYMIKITQNGLSEIKKLLSEETVDTLLSEKKYGIEIINEK